MGTRNAWKSSWMFGIFIVVLVSTTRGSKFTSAFVPVDNRQDASVPGIQVGSGHLLRPILLIAALLFICGGKSMSVWRSGTHF